MFLYSLLDFPIALCCLCLCSCITLGGDGEDESSVSPTPLGRIASFYYLHHRTMDQLVASMGPGMDVQQLLLVGEDRS